MTTDIGLMPITHVVHYIRTLQSEVSLAFKATDFGYLSQEIINLPGISTRLWLLVLIPLSIYLLIKRLRYLSKLRSEHNNIFEAQLGGIPFMTDKPDAEIESEKENTPVDNRKSLFHPHLTSALDKRLETL